MKKYLKKTAALLLAALLLTTLLSSAAAADTGPKPSVRISFTGQLKQVCYATLLSKSDTAGPAQAWDGVSDDHPQPGETDYEIWRAFAEYRDTDGFRFLQLWWQVSPDEGLDWTYFPPTTFKLLLYFPETGAFMVSGVYEAYAFDSYFTAYIQPSDSLSPAQAPITLQKSYDHTWELLSLACRIVMTVAVEIAVALLFGLRGRRLLWLIAGVNLATQAALNVALNIVNYRSGSWAFLFYFVILELAVLLAEAVLYAALLPKISGGSVSHRRAVVYAAIANLCSAAGGLLLAKVLPGVF